MVITFGANSDAFMERTGQLKEERAKLAAA
jgi:hypothetical protein